MKTYKDFKYCQEKDGWWVVFPSKFKSFVKAVDENEVKAIIDSIIEAKL